MMEIKATFSCCGCHTGDDHQKMRLSSGGHILLDCCLNILWLMRAMDSPSRTTPHSSLTYTWEFLLNPPSEEWHKALREME